MPRTMESGEPLRAFGGALHPLLRPPSPKVSSARFICGEGAGCFPGGKGVVQGMYWSSELALARVHNTASMSTPTLSIW